jgi:branched-chain amino acid transport system permease protein
MTSWPWVAVAAILAVVIMRNVVYSSHGRAVLSVRENEIASSAMGIDIARYKTVAFVMGCFYAGIAGALYAHLYSFLHPSNFDFLKSVDMLLIVVLGGLGSMSGTIMAALGWTFLLEGLRVILPPEILDFRFVIYPLLLIIAMLLRPKGLFGGMEWSFLRAPKVEKRAHGVSTES